MDPPHRTRTDPGLETLLALGGYIYRMDDGHWVKIEAWEVEPSEAVPHGIRYSLTLHDPYNRRVLGFDNAHAPKPLRRRYGGRKVVAWDHRHGASARREEPYEFKDAGQLLEDFWRAVDEYLRKA